MAEIHLRNLFFKSRIPDNVCQVILLLIYSPIGLTLVVLRSFILLQAYLSALILPEMSAIRRFVLKVLAMVLGTVVIEKKRFNLNKKNKVFFSNHVTYFDYIPLHLATGCLTPCMSDNILPMTWGLTNFGFEHGREVFKRNLKFYLMTSKQPLLIHPEEETTSGRFGLLKFSPWYSFLSCHVQPICIKVSRPVLKIAPNVLGATPLVELFWFLFAPFTLFEITYLFTETQLCEETDESFMSRVEYAIAEELNLEQTECTAYQKEEHKKKVMDEHAQQQSLGSDFYDLRLTRDYQYVMAHRVSEVLPHVPMNVILNDLRKTKDVDTTIANILEGIVNFTPVPQEQQPQESDPTPRPNIAATPIVHENQMNDSDQNLNTFSDNAEERMSILSKRKHRLLQSAIKKYSDKHKPSDL